MEPYERINKYFTDKHIDKSQVAKGMGFSTQQLSLCLSGKRGLEIKEFVRLCNTMRVGPEELLNYE